ncbi:MAG TPA: cytochrome c-type biogenesis protein [Anaerolineales bacterium]|nr:cytochrome c-type biogenesis protein [Anaerolineales bacterium]
MISSRIHGTTRRTAYRVLFALLAVILVAIPLVSASAQDPTPTDDEVNRIARYLYCPVCENTPLDVCPTEACRQWRDLIRQQLAAGWSEARIREYFVEQYGARVLAEPPRTGLNWLVYILPPLFILAGTIMLFRSFRAWRAPAAGESSAPRPTGPLDGEPDEYVAQLEAELKKRS